MTRAARALLLGLGTSVLVACGGGGNDGVENASDGEEDVTSTTYVDSLDYWHTAADQDAWLAMRREMDAEFDAVCGDTFCGGDYANLTSLGFTCGVSSVRGRVHECVWDFTGTSHLVFGQTGTVQTSIASFQCRFTAATSARALLEGLGAAPDVLHRTIPGTTTTLYDVIAACFQHPIGASPISQGTGTPYGDAADATGTDQGQYYDAERALKAGFDQLCPDTFCEGDFANLQALRLACSARATTGTLRECKWLFGGSYDTVDPKTGAVTVHTASHACRLPVRGATTALTSLLVSAPSAIDATLPGSTLSARDVLGTCLSP